LFQDLRKPLREYFIKNAQDHDLAVSLTIKQQDGPASLTKLEAGKNLTHFLNRLNKRAFGNAASRHKRKFPVITMLERTLSGRWHHHLSLRNPFSNVKTCRLAVEDCWAKTRWGYHEVDVQELYDLDGWLCYITKSQNIDGWDPENTHMVC
jgi:hypothetical protein